MNEKCKKVFNREVKAMKKERELSLPRIEFILKCSLLTVCFLTLMLHTQTLCYSQEVSWTRIYEDILGEDTLPGFYCGGFERNKHNLCDIDGDGDLDFFIGMWDGTVMFFKNIGNATSPKFEFITEKFGNINVRGTMKKGYAAPEFVDIDNDGDYDCFVGDYVGKVHFYKNEGTAQSCSFALVDTHLVGPDSLWRHSNLAFCDIDKDKDYDMWVGDERGRLAFYQNTGRPDSFYFTLVTDTFCCPPGYGYKQIDPTLVDIDNDNDYDLFYGEMKGRLVYWRNIGDSVNYNFEHVTDSLCPYSYNRGGGVFADIDSDGLFDLFWGGKDGLNLFFRNEGTPETPQFKLVTSHYLYIDFGTHSAPTFCDIDGDKDIDMFVGADDMEAQTAGAADYGRVFLCRNVGSTTHPKWVYDRREFSNITTPNYPAPAFVDIDSDKDMDLFIGTSKGKLIFWRNAGNPSQPDMIEEDKNFANINVEEASKPTFGDIDNDEDYDLIVGNSKGKILLFKNKGTPTNPQFDSLPDTCIDSVNLYVAPILGDVDLDNDLDIMAGFNRGCLRFYKNEGDSTNPNWVVVDSSIYDTMNVHRLSTPTLGDIDGDKDLDLVVGEGDGGVNRWENKLIGVEESVRSLVRGYRWEIYPNPFVCNAVIELRNLGVKELVEIQIYDLGGRLVRNWQFRKSDFNRIVWDGKTFDGKQVGNGVYFCRLVTGSYNVTKKLIRIR